jgi:hypothetical protein
VPTRSLSQLHSIVWVHYSHTVSLNLLNTMASSKLSFLFVREESQTAELTSGVMVLEDN